MDLEFRYNNLQVCSGQLHWGFHTCGVQKLDNQGIPESSLCCLATDGPRRDTKWCFPKISTRGRIIPLIRQWSSEEHVKHARFSLKISDQQTQRWTSGQQSLVSQMGPSIKPIQVSRSELLGRAKKEWNKWCSECFPNQWPGCKYYGQFRTLQASDLCGE